MWKIIIAYVPRPIICSDFLQHCALLANVKRKLIDSISTSCFMSRKNDIFSVKSFPVPEKSLFRPLLSDFKHITHLSCILLEVIHHIEMKKPPVHCKPRRLPPGEHKILQREFMMQFGIRCASKSSWANPLPLFPKSSNKCRPCGGYSALNKIIYPVPS